MAGGDDVVRPTIVQTVKLAISASDYTGNLKTLFERSYGLAIGICSGECKDSNGKTSWLGHVNSVTSSAARRASAAVKFTIQGVSLEPNKQAAAALGRCTA